LLTLKASFKTVTEDDQNSSENHFLKEKLSRASASRFFLQKLTSTNCFDHPVTVFTNVQCHVIVE